MCCGPCGPRCCDPCGGCYNCCVELCCVPCTPAYIQCSFMPYGPRGCC
ncbi:male-specific sperm protein Mst84Dd [Drosophila sechellia]|nr:male-specific sperm protein Mst84Dd [Drosophila sechellia]